MPSPCAECDAKSVPVLSLSETSTVRSKPRRAKSGMPVDGPEYTIWSSESISRRCSLSDPAEDEVPGCHNHQLVIKQEPARVALLTSSSLKLPAADWILRAGGGDVGPGDVEVDLDFCGDEGLEEEEAARGRFTALDMTRIISACTPRKFPTMHAHLAGSGCITTRLLSIALSIRTHSGCLSNINLRCRESARLAGLVASQTRSLAVTTHFSPSACVASDQHLPPDFRQVHCLVIVIVNVLGHDFQEHTTQQAGVNWQRGGGWPRTCDASTRTHACNPGELMSVSITITGNSRWRASLPAIRHVMLSRLGASIVRVLHLHRPERAGTLSY